MPKRDWQTDWDLTQRFKEAGYTIGLVQQGNGQYGYSFTRVENGVFVNDRLIPVWFRAAYEGWPAALEERTRLEGRVREVQQLIARLYKELDEAEKARNYFDMLKAAQRMRSELQRWMNEGEE